MRFRLSILILITLSVNLLFAQKNIDFLKQYNIQISDLIDNGNYELAQAKTDSLYTWSQETDYKEGVAESYNLKGVINRDQSNLRDALDNFLSALKLFEELKLPIKVAGIQNNIGLIYAEIKEYRTALAYYFKAVSINLKFQKNVNLAINYNNIATCYQKLKQFSSAQTYLNKSLKLRQESQDTIGMAMAYHNIGLTYQLTEKGDSAILFFNQSLSYLRSMSENIGHAYNYLELGNTYLQKSDLKNAEFYLLKSLRIAENSDLEGVKTEVYNYLSQAYEHKSDFKNAFKYQNLFLTSKEQVESDENKNEILKKELEYDFNKRQELQRLEAENKQAISNAEIKSQKQFTMYAIIGLVILSGLILIVFRSYIQKRKANFIISKQKEIVEHKNKEITDSINYAKYIQAALLPTEKAIQELGLDCFVLFKPKDIVSGDFYWIHQNKKDDSVYIAVADCTGHGVPGAMVSVVGNNGLNRCVEEFGLTETGKILDKLSVLVEETFEKSDNELKDGMDISLLKITQSNNGYNIQWSGANNPLWIIEQSKNKEVLELTANKQPIGKFVHKNRFITHNLQLQKGDTLYLFTDGYADQFGGPKGKKFKYKQLQEKIIEVNQMNLIQKKEALSQSFVSWKEDFEQVDDVCLIGIKL